MDDRGLALPPLTRVAEHGDQSPEARVVRRRAAAGELVRCAPGTFVEASAWARLDGRERHVVRALARVPRLRGGVVVSHDTAAALHHIPRSGPWPDRVHVLDPRRSTAQTTALVVRHAAAVPDGDVHSVLGLSCTSPLRSLVDCLCRQPLVDAVTGLDSSLRRGLVLSSDVAAALADRSARGAPGAVRALRALEFARAEAESPGESFTRVQLHRVGAPPPVLQQVFPLDGRDARVDFWFPDQGVVLEFDGRVKYGDPEMLAGRTPADVVIAERARERAILRSHRDRVRLVERLVWAEVASLPVLRRILLQAGIPVGPPRAL
ncbi:hypothetical protein [Frigoribacterium salinisoli]